MRISLRHFRRSSLKSPAARASARGFTLIELLVVVAIMVLITAAVLLRQARFDSSTLLRSLSYSVALTIRSAQVYGTSVLGVKSGGSTVFAPAYGVHFSDPQTYLLYADVNNNGYYDLATDVVVQTYQVGAGFRISKFCGVRSNGTMHCSTDGSSITSLDIYFKRPDPDALFNAMPIGDTFSGAYIQLSAINDPTNLHCISVSQTGEIAVLQPSQCS